MAGGHNYAFIFPGKLGKICLRNVPWAVAKNGDTMRANNSLTPNAAVTGKLSLTEFKIQEARNKKQEILSRERRPRRSGTVPYES